MFATFTEIQEAANLGYQTSRDNQIGHRFSHGSRVIWSTRSGWMTADLVRGSYTRHRHFMELTDALKRPLIGQSLDVDSTFAAGGV